MDNHMWIGNINYACDHGIILPKPTGQLSHEESSPAMSSHQRIPFMRWGWVVAN